LGNACACPLPTPPPPPPPPPDPLCGRVDRMIELNPSGKWCDGAAARRNSKEECEKHFYTGTNGHVYACGFDAPSSRCTMASSSIMCCDHLCKRLQGRVENNAGSKGSGPWCGGRSGSHSECEDSFHSCSNAPHIRDFGDERAILCDDRPRGLILFDFHIGLASGSFHVRRCASISLPSVLLNQYGACVPIVCSWL